MENEVTDEFLSLKESLDTVVRSLQGTSAQTLVGVFACWEMAVGSAVAMHAKPILLEAGRLVVEVDQPGWATQLRFLEKDLLHSLVEYTGEDSVHTLDIRVARRASRKRTV
jgi:predicted nucleic acid-binding Zn ribbon protein